MGQPGHLDPLEMGLRALHEMAGFFQALALADVAQEFQDGALGRGHQEV